MSCRKYLCHDPKLRNQIAREVQAAKRAGLGLKNVTPDLIVMYGGYTIGTALVQSIPVLGPLGIQVIAGLVVIFYNIGIDAFCQDFRPTRKTK